MTQTEQTVRQVFAGDGTANPLTVIIPFFNQTDLVVEQEIGGVNLAMVLGTDYTVTGGSGTGGTITPEAVIANGTNWVVYRVIPLTQPTDLENQSSIKPSAYEIALDRLLLQILDRTDAAARSLKADAGEVDPTGLELPDLATRASQLFGWDASGNVTAIDPESVIGGDVEVSSWGAQFVALANWQAARIALKITYGLDANKGTAITPGHLHISSDTLELYYANGVIWQLLNATQPSIIKPNLVANGSAQINQRQGCNNGTTYPNDDFGFCLDHVLLVSDGNDAATVIQNTAERPDGAPNCFELVTATTAKKYGLLFPLSAEKSAALLSENDDSKCSIRFKYKATAGIRSIRAQVLAFTGTVDALNAPVTSGNWAAEGTNPTWTGDWTAEGDAADDITCTTSWQTAEASNIAIDTPSTNNLALVIWVDDMDLAAGTDKLYLAEVHLNQGDVLSPYKTPPYIDEWNECVRHMQKSFPYATMPIQNGGTAGCIQAHVGDTSDDCGAQVWFQPPMYKEPAMTFYNPKAANTKWRNLVGSDSEEVFVSGKCESSFYAILTSHNEVAGAQMGVHYDAVAEIVA